MVWNVWVLAFLIGSFRICSRQTVLIPQLSSLPPGLWAPPVARDLVQISFFSGHPSFLSCVKPVQHSICCSAFSLVYSLKVPSLFEATLAVTCHLCCIPIASELSFLALMQDIHSWKHTKVFIELRMSSISFSLFSVSHPWRHKNI